MALKLRKTTVEELPMEKLDSLMGEFPGLKGVIAESGEKAKSIFKSTTEFTTPVKAAIIGIGALAVVGTSALAVGFSLSGGFPQAIGSTLLTGTSIIGLKNALKPKVEYEVKCG